MIELITGFLLTIISLLVGFQLGKNQTIVTSDTKKQIQQIFKRVVPRSDVGPVIRPSAEDNYYRDNPSARVEEEVMSGAIEDLNK